MGYVTAGYVAFLVVLEILAANYVRPWDVIPHGDKIAHFVFVGILAALLNVNFQFARIGLGWFRIPIGVLIVFVIATLAEAAQHLMSTRTFSMQDLACSYAGIICLSPLAMILSGRNRSGRE
jgi:VanZ family protein